MANTAPTLLPIFRSDALGNVLAYLVGHDPTQPLPARTMGAQLGISKSSQTRIVRELENSGLITTTMVGTSTHIHINTGSPLWTPLSQAAIIAYGPPVVLGQELADVPCDSAWIFGSWAARYHGVPGHAPNDVDVAVVGDNIDRDAAYDACARAEKRLAREVNPKFYTTQRWDTDDVLARTIKAKPMVRILPPP